MLGAFALELLALRLMDSCGSLTRLSPELLDEERDPLRDGGSRGNREVSLLAAPFIQHRTYGRVAPVSKPLADGDDGQRLPLCFEETYDLANFPRIDSWFAHR